MGFRFGNNNPDNIYVGNQLVSRIYKGDTQVWRSPELVTVTTPGIVSSADPDILSHPTGTAGQQWLYFIDFTGPVVDGQTTGVVKRIVSTDNGKTWSAPVTTLEGVPATAYEEFETPCVIYNDVSGAYYLYTLGYTQAGDALSGDIYLAHTDPANWTLATTPVLTRTVGGPDENYLMEPTGLWTGSKVELIYTGGNATGNRLVHVEAADGFSFGTKTVIFGPGDAPVGAFYQQAAGACVIPVPGGHIMAFTGLDNTLTNAGGIGLAFSNQGLKVGWTFGASALIAPFGGATEVVAPGLHYDADTDVLSVYYGYVEGGIIKLAMQQMTLAYARNKTGV